MRWVILGALVVACSSPPTDVDQPETLAAGQLGLVRQVSWPGAGTELTIKLSTLDGAPYQSNDAPPFRIVVDGQSLSSASQAVSAQSLDPLVLALLVKPAETEALRREQAMALQSFVMERPTQERIGIFLWRNEVQQVSGFTWDRQRLLSHLESLAFMPPVESPLEADEALVAVEERVFEVEGRAPRGLRAVVVDGEDSIALPPTRAAVAVGLSGAAERLEEFASTSYFQVSLCGPLSGGNAEIEVTGLEGVLPVFLAPVLPEEASMPCDLAQMREAQRVYPETLELVFSEDQREVYDQRVASLSRSDFDLRVRLDGGSLIGASAHLRGRGTLGCERKSYTLTLNGPGRHLLPNSRTDEFYLLSMCADDRYVQQYTANQLMKELGLFPLEFRFIELRLDGETQGVYLLLEKAREELVRDQSRVHSVMRRRFTTNPPEDFFENKFDTGGFDAAKLYAEVLEDSSLMRERIDISQYLRFLALMTAYQNGDYIDEIWVVASEQRVPSDEPGLWFETMAWDNDDLFSECHYSGQFAFEDPNELVYCAEAAIDRTLLADPVLYDQYVDSLEQVLEELVTPERFDAAVLATEEAIMPILSRPGVSAAMVRLVADNPNATDPEEAKRDVAAKLDGLSAAYRARHAVLLQRIATYRGAQP